MNLKLKIRGEKRESKIKNKFTIFFLNTLNQNKKNIKTNKKIKILKFINNIKDGANRSI